MISSIQHNRNFMFWITLGLLAHFAWALVNIGDKYIIGNRIKNPYVYMFWLFWTGLLVVFLVPFVGFYVPTFHELLFLLFAGLFWVFGGLPYIKAMQIEEATRVNIWWSFIPIFSFIIGWIFFGEILTGRELVAFVLLVLAGVVAAVHAKKRTIVFSRAVWYMLIAGIAYASYAVLLHQVTATVPFAVAYIWVTILPIPFTLVMLLFPSFRTDFIRQTRSASMHTVVLVLAVRLVEGLGLFFNVWALSLASAALVYSLEGSQALFVFGMVALISLFAPKVMKEDFDRANVFLKLLAISIMIIGILVLSLT